MTPSNIGRLRTFVMALANLVDLRLDEPELLTTASRLLTDLVAHDDWLPDAYARPDTARYQQYLLHCDSAERFCIASFVWGPGQATAIHDHTVWGLVGVLRGAEISRSYLARPDGRLEQGASRRLDAGAVEILSPTHGDIHKVSNAFDDRSSVSIHVYGANIAAVRRSLFAPTGERRSFVSGYSATALPNLWDIEANRAPVA